MFPRPGRLCPRGQVQATFIPNTYYGMHVTCITLPINKVSYVLGRYKQDPFLRIFKIGERRKRSYTHHLCLCELQAVSIYGRDVRRRHLAGNVTGESIRKVKERDAHCTFFSRLANLTKSRRERSHFRIARAIPQVLRLRIFGRVICECEG